jgi:hypothetical protein
LYFITDEEETEERPKKRQKKEKEPSAPKYETPLVRCCCHLHHNSFFNGNCPTNCTDQETGHKYDIGECPTCRCPCNKVTLLTDYAKVLNQRKMEKNPSAKIRLSIAHEASEYLQTGEKVRKKAKAQIRETYKKAYSDGKLKSSGTIKRAIENHASYSKARHFVTNPPSREVRVQLAKQMKVLVYCHCYILIVI